MRARAGVRVDGRAARDPGIISACVRHIGKGKSPAGLGAHLRLPASVTAQVRRGERDKVRGLQPGNGAGLRVVELGHGVAEDEPAHAVPHDLSRGGRAEGKRGPPIRSRSAPPAGRRIWGASEGFGGLRERPTEIRSRLGFWATTALISSASLWPQTSIPSKVSVLRLHLLACISTWHEEQGRTDTHRAAWGSAPLGFGETGAAEPSTLGAPPPARAPPWGSGL